MNSYPQPQSLEPTLPPQVLKELTICHTLQEASNQVLGIVRAVKYQDQPTMTNSANDTIYLTYCRSYKWGGSVMMKETHEWTTGLNP
jgi:hypothetical protein